MLLKWLLRHLPNLWHHFEFITKTNLKIWRSHFHFREWSEKSEHACLIHLCLLSQRSSFQHSSRSWKLQHQNITPFMKQNEDLPNLLTPCCSTNSGTFWMHRSCFSIFVLLPVIVDSPAYDQSMSSENLRWFLYPYPSAARQKQMVTNTCST